MQGKIKKLHENGYGFIIPDNGGKDVFFHRNDLGQDDFETLEEGMSVSFEMGDSHKGPKAINVVVLGSDGEAVNAAVEDDDSEDESM